MSAVELKRRRRELIDTYRGVRTLKTREPWNATYVEAVEVLRAGIREVEDQIAVERFLRSL